MNEKKANTFTKIILPIIIILCVIAADQITKIAVVKYNDSKAIEEGDNPNSGDLNPTWLSYNPVNILGDWLRINLVYNDSAIFGMNFGLPEAILSNNIKADEFENKVLNNVSEYHKKTLLENYIKDEDKQVYILKKGIEKQVEQKLISIIKPYGYITPVKYIILIGLTSLSTIIVIFILTRIKPERLMPKILISFIIGGAFGNLIDRIFGYITLKGEMKLFFMNGVVDWIDMGLPAGVFGLERRLPWAFYNIADSCLTISIILLLLYVIFSKKSNDIFISRKKKEKDNIVTTPTTD
jgi:lipoprotein signal peptidase